MKTLFWIIVAVLAVGGGWYYFSHKAAPAPAAGLANPASVNCTQTLGGTLEIKDEANGQAGYCHLPDGRVCEEWGLFRDNTCTPPSDGEATSTASEGTYYAEGNLLLGTDGNAAHGTYLIGSNGMALYTYDKDAENTSNCTGQCAANWPPYLVKSQYPLQNVQSGIPGTPGTLTRADGSLQVTYEGKPLYFYVGDKTGSDTSGDGAGGVWHLVKP
jgi:predicted lipoprotein with Yx(FWY)xxD motif/putative hemolysin